jgi:hypothetical protein
MANQILAGAVFQAGQVIAGVDANNPPYVGPPIPTYLVVRVAEGERTSGSYPYQDRVYLYDVYNIEADPIVINSPNGDDANQWNNYSDGVGHAGSIITSRNEQLFMGAQYEDLGGLGNQGVVYVYDKSDLTTPVTTMTSPTPSENGYFGKSVTTNDTHLFVSEQGDQTIFVYDLSDLSSSPTVISDTRPPANSQWNFASQMYATNTHLVVGDDNYDNSSTSSYNHGSVSIYDLSDLSSPIHLTDEDLQGACSWMGLRISNDGSQIYVGVNASYNPNNSTIHNGQMQIRDITTGNLVSTITYPAPNGNYAAFAGYIEETDDKFILSAMLENVGGDGQQGRVYVYDKSNLSSPSQIITAPLSNSTDSGSDRFGASLVTDDNYLYVSDRGSAGAASWYATSGTDGAYVWRYDLNDLSAAPYQITEPSVDRAEHIYEFGTKLHMVQFPFPPPPPQNLVVPSNWQGNEQNTVIVSPNGDIEYSTDGVPVKLIQTVTLPADTTISVSMNVASDNIGPSLNHGRNFVIIPTGTAAYTSLNHVIAHAVDAGYAFTSSSTTDQYDTFGAQTIAGPVPNQPFNSGGEFTLSWYNQNEIVVDLVIFQGNGDEEYGNHNWFITDLFVGEAS